MLIPLAKPSPARLSDALSELREMEERAVFTNFGPINRSFEEHVLEQIFGGVGACTTACNATIGLMLAIRHAMETRSTHRRRFALMPSFTFAAAAQAAIWNGLTPLFCDIDPLNWSASQQSESALLERFGKDIAVVVPYAALGFDIDLNRYEQIQKDYGIPVVIDAAASLGTVSENGQGFGTGFSGAVIYSMHATKSFATSEGAIVYSGDAAFIQAIRRMTNFGFNESRNAESIGLNGKMSEVQALLAELCLRTFSSVMRKRSEIVQLYRDCLPFLTFQAVRGRQQAHQFASFLIPSEMKELRNDIRSEMLRRGVESATYFSPHVAEQDYFQQFARGAHLPVTNDVASRMLTLPLYNAMTTEEVSVVVDAVRASIEHVAHKDISGAVPGANFEPRVPAFSTASTAI